MTLRVFCHRAIVYDLPGGRHVLFPSAVIQSDICTMKAVAVASALGRIAL